MINTAAFRKGALVSAEKLHPYSGQRIKIEATPMDVDLGWAAMKSLARGKVTHGKLNLVQAAV